MPPRFSDSLPWHSGERKNTDKKSGKYFYYAFYLAMLAVFAVIVSVM